MDAAFERARTYLARWAWECEELLACFSSRSRSLSAVLVRNRDIHMRSGVHCCGRVLRVACVYMLPLFPDDTCVRCMRSLRPVRAGVPSSPPLKQKPSLPIIPLALFFSRFQFRGPFPVLIVVSRSHSKPSRLPSIASVFVLLVFSRAFSSTPCSFLPCALPTPFFFMGMCRFGRNSGRTTNAACSV